MFRELQRKKQKLDEAECIHLLTTEKRGVLSVLGDDGYPYGMPMNHWYEPSDGCVYFHCGKLGHRIDALRRCDKVSFCVYDKGTAEPGKWALKVRSVIIFGRMELIDNMDMITDITAKLSRKFTHDEEYITHEIEAYACNTLLMRLVPEHICGKLVTEE